MCGEYGEKLGRPHYHALLFGHEFPDRVLWKSPRGIPVFTSQILETLWGKGFTTVGDVTFESAAYVARYIMKKQNGQYAEHAYLRLDDVDKETGEITQVRPEFTKMSLKPWEPGEPGGIGARWFQRFGNDVFPDDFVVHKGKRFRTPRYYDKLFEASHGEAALESVKAQRKQKAVQHEVNNTPARLKVREKVQQSKLNLLKRELT